MLTHFILILMHPKISMTDRNTTANFQTQNFQNHFFSLVSESYLSARWRLSYFAFSQKFHYAIILNHVPQENNFTLGDMDEVGKIQTLHHEKINLLKNSSLGPGMENEMENR